MQEYNGDFHIHGPRSIGVSKDMNLPNIVHGAHQKGLQLVATGDCFQPDWLAYLKENLIPNNGSFTYDGVDFVLQTEVEDKESVHEVILFPSFDVVEAIKQRFKPASSNIDHEWGGRPRVNLSPEEIVEIVTEEGGLAGPAHAFTPFKSIFRQGKFSNLDEAYGAQAKNVYFLELGLSANTDYADRISNLHRLTFMTNSDAHSPTPTSLGREFNTFQAESTAFDELDQAIRRKNDRRFTRNVGFDPRMGKYNVLFCKACRRRVLLEPPREGEGTLNLLSAPTYDDEFVHVLALSDTESMAYIRKVNEGKITCPACAAEKKKAKIFLGVSDRVRLLADLPENDHPSHRAEYKTIINLTEIIRVALGVGSSGSKVVSKAYNRLVDTYGPEIALELDRDLGTIDGTAIEKEIKRPGLVKTVAAIIESFREGKITFKPGGGGTFGELVFEAE
jgi:uncharacterized protein (TIGR00375 family)